METCSHNFQLSFQTFWVVCLISLYPGIFMGFLKSLLKYIFESRFYLILGIGSVAEKTVIWRDMLTVGR